MLAQMSMLTVAMDKINSRVDRLDQEFQEIRLVNIQQQSAVQSHQPVNPLMQEQAAKMQLIN